MAEDVNTDRINEILRRELLATDGPWTQNGDAISASDGTFITWIAYTDALPVSERLANAEFVAHAREDVPWLARYAVYLQAEQERLQREIGRLQVLVGLEYAPKLRDLEVKYEGERALAAAYKQDLHSAQTEVMSLRGRLQAYELRHAEQEQEMARAKADVARLRRGIQAIIDGRTA